MVHFISLHKLADDVDDARVDDLMRTSRSLLLRIQEVHNVRSGKRIDPENEYRFCVAIDFESLDKLSMFREDPLWVKFQHEFLDKVSVDSTELVYETEPGKNVKYS